ncbi:MAG: hypothetical protein F6K41_27625, partial [Symploca sp. SIO3E6]|nr:hypothetical protein [Caldora sp. SIO3E6]
MTASPQSVLRFNGTSDYISVPDSESLQLSAYTVEVWIKPSGKPNQVWKGIVGKPGRNYNIWIHNTGYVHHRFHTKGSTNTGAPNTTKRSLKWNQWSHVAITNDGKTAKTYINGQLKKEGATGGALIVDQTPLYLARNLDGKSDNYFKGQLADIRIWNQVHSQDEIKNLMGQRLKGDEAGLVAYWPLNEGSGTIAKDQTNSNNQGTIHGGTWEQEELDFITPSLPTEPLPETELIALQVDNGQYLCTEKGGGSSVVANRDKIGPWETLTLHQLGDSKVAIQADNGQYICAEGGGGSSVVANRDKIGPWETFTLHQLGDSKVAIQAENGQYLCAEGGGGGSVVANRDKIGPWETFVYQTIAATTPQLAQSVATFDGKNDYIEVPYKPELNPAKFTLSCWAKVEGSQGKWRSPVTCRTDGPQGGYILYA